MGIYFIIYAFFKRLRIIMGIKQARVETGRGPFRRADVA